MCRASSISALRITEHAKCRPTSSRSALLRSWLYWQFVNFSRCHESVQLLRCAWVGAVGGEPDHHSQGSEHGEGLLSTSASWQVGDSWTQACLVAVLECSSSPSIGIERKGRWETAGLAFTTCSCLDNAMSAEG